MLNTSEFVAVSNLQRVGVRRDVGLARRRLPGCPLPVEDIQQERSHAADAFVAVSLLLRLSSQQGIR